jgi:glycosyltransferase involved in cell wall biosynthesis
MNMLRLTAELHRQEIDVCLWLLGEFQSKYLERETHRFMRSNDITDNVRLFGYVDYEDLFSYLALADLGLLLANKSRFERNIPTKFFEYLYAGLPVILTEINSLTEYMKDSYCISIPDLGPQVAASSVLELLSDNRKRSKMGESGRKKVQSEYCWEVESKKLVEIYDGLIG